MSYTTRVTLKYPNGQTHDELLMTSVLLEPGSEFELYGRHWQAIRWAATSKSRFNYVPQSMLCSSHMTPSPTARGTWTDARVVRDGCAHARVDGSSAA
jgi:hypothetical protein